MTASEEEFFDRELGCYLYELRADYRNKHVALILGGPSDMTGAVRLAKRVMPSVERVSTYVEHKPDTYYVRRGGHHDSVVIDGAAWLALDPPPSRS